MPIELTGKPIAQTHINMSIQISVNKEGLVMRNRRLQEGRHFQPPVEDKITTGRFTKRFVRNQAGSVVGLQFSSNRTHDVEFEKQEAENAS